MRLRWIDKAREGGWSEGGIQQDSSVFQHQHQHISLRRFGFPCVCHNLLGIGLESPPPNSDSVPVFPVTPDGGRACTLKSKFHLRLVAFYRTSVPGGFPYLEQPSATSFIAMATVEHVFEQAPMVLGSAAPSGDLIHAERRETIRSLGGQAQV